MRKLVMWLVAISLLAAAGCGSRRTYNTPEGKVTVDRSGSKITMESEKGKVEVQGEKGAATITGTGDKGKTTVKINQGVSEKDLGIPLYPGAAVGLSTVQTQEKGEAAAQAMLATTDSVDTVKAFYQKQFPKAETAVDMNLPTGRMVQLAQKEGDVQKVIHISRDKGAKETKIVLSRIKGSK
ncbi:MAG: hypothetical protein ABSD48_06700 [Armatimonadota bacterium]|jgi:hypothetical protein